jgi:hypothetical protein
MKRAELTSQLKEREKLAKKILLEKILLGK